MPLPAEAQPATMHDVVVTLRAQADLGAVSRSGGQRAAHRRMLEQLRSTAERGAATRSSACSPALRATGQVGEVTPYWISNSIAVSASDSALAILRSLPQVLSVTPDAVIAAVPDVPTATLVEPNLSQIGAPDLWARGLTRPGCGGRGPRHRSRSVAPRSRSHLPWRCQQLVRPLRAAPQRSRRLLWPRHLDHRGGRRGFGGRHRNRRGPGCAMDRGAGLQRRRPGIRLSDPRRVAVGGRP